MADNDASSAAPRNENRNGGNGENPSSSSHQRSGHERGGRSQGRGGRGGGRGRGQGRGKGFGGNQRGGRDKKADMGRGEYNRMNVDKRQRNEDFKNNRKQREEDGQGAKSNDLYTKEEIEAEGRKPKRKVAVMIGYAGSGYKGMQINAQEKTIEGDLFNAFVKAGAISKANADDSKKSSLVRCARTDKGVHAAGNVISLKLIVEDPNIVQNINEHLPAQIRVWGMERTNGSFSCYQTCDSRWYEYLIPTFCFLPPNPQTYLAKKLVESAEKEGVFETYQARQEDAASFWEKTEENYVKPILDRLDPELRSSVLAAIHSSEEAPEDGKKDQKPLVKEFIDKSTSDTPKRKREEQDHEDTKIISPKKSKINETRDADEPPEQSHPTTSVICRLTRFFEEDRAKPEFSSESSTPQVYRFSEEDRPRPVFTDISIQQSSQDKDGDTVMKDGNDERPTASKSVLSPVEAAIKEVKAAYIAAKKAYRMSEQRRARVQDALNAYIGTRNFHNYTIQKRFSDPSAKRVIRSFNVGKDPVIINDTEWLSLKVHGQSFMMHQIRKMVAMVALVVRCGSPLSIIQESYGPANISIPKAPGLGLLLERPVFETYNERAAKEFSREKIDFDKYKKEMDEFKQREIYDRIFREEEKDHQFHSFFHHLDNYQTDFFLWVTASGISAAKQSQAQSRREDASDDEVDVNGEEG